MKLLRLVDIWFDGKAPTDDSWKDENALQQIDLNTLEQDEITSIADSTESSSLQPGEHDADIMTPWIWSIYHHWRRHVYSMWIQ